MVTFNHKISIYVTTDDKFGYGFIKFNLLTNCSKSPMGALYMAETYTYVGKF
jgi:hypothetical protein